MRTKDNPNSLIGIGLVVIGAVLLIGTLGWADVGAWYRWLPAVLILVGAYQLYVNKFKQVIGPLLLMGIGTALLLATLGVISWGVFGALWPIALVAFGLSILLGRGKAGSSEHTSDRLSAVAFLSGVERRITTQSFTGGDITAFMGGVELDFRDAGVTDRPATVNINAMMGGVELRLPEDWAVDMRISALMGGVSDDRKSRMPTPDGPPHLVLTGLALMGGVTLKS